MLHDQRTIEINTPPEKVFKHIETMPNKFPIYKILETRPFVFLRIALVDGLRTAVSIVFNKNFHKIIKGINAEVLKPGDSMGPFKLSEVIQSEKYFFILKSFFFNCQTGYILTEAENGTRLNFDTVAADPDFKERIYWFLIKPFHIIFANKVLKNIKKQVEFSELRTVSPSVLILFSFA